MGTCLSKKNGSSSTSSNTVSHSENCVSVTLSKPTDPEVSLKKKTLQEKHDPEAAPQDEGEVRKEVFIIKHRKSHDDRERTTTSKSPPFVVQSPAPQQGDGASSSNEESMVNKFAPSTPNVGLGVRTSSCTKEEVDAILIQCGRLSRSSSCRKYSGSKRSFDFDNCDNDTPSAEDDQRRAKGSGSEENDVAAESRRHRQSPRRSQGRRRTPSRERDQSTGKERRLSRSPGRRSSDTSANASNNNASSRPGKMVSVPPTVSSLAMDKSNNCGGESGTKRITVKRNVGDVGSRGAASPRTQSPARVNGNVASARVLSENQQHQQPSLSRNNSSRKAEQSPYRRNPLSEVDNNSKVQQNKPKTEAEAMQKPNGRVALEKGVTVNCKTKEHHEDVSLDSAVVKTTVASSGVDNLKPQGLTRSRSSRRSRDLDINPESVVNVNPTHSYASLLLEDIQNFHQKNTPQQPSSTSLPACLTKACSIIEAVGDLSYTTSSNFSGAFSEDRKSPSTQQSFRNGYYGKKVQGSKDPFVESEVDVGDDVMEPSLHKYVTVKRGSAVVDMDDQESSGSNSFTVSSSGQHHWGAISCSSWEPNSADSTDSWTSRLSSREEGQKSLECKVSSDIKKKKNLNSKRTDCDHEHSSGIGRGRLGSDKGVCV